MTRRPWLLLAAPLCVVFVAASVAFAATPDTEHASNTELDPPHVMRPIAAPDPTLEPLASFELWFARAGKARLELLQRQAQLAQAQAEAQAAAAAQAQADADAEAAAASRRSSSVVNTGTGGGGGGDSLACIRAHESDTAGGYGAVSSGGTYRGAYQFLPSTWDSTAAGAGRGDLVGVDPAAASPADQDAIASHLYSQAGAQPWGGGC
jgi:hypothetical protein